MEPRRAARALAAASSTMIGPDDIGGALASVLQHCRDGLDVDACGILIDVASTPGLTVLAASSHEAHELEIHQAAIGEGPCVEAWSGNVTVQAGGADIGRRWPVFAAAMSSAGFSSVHASPMTVDGATFGAMGLFRQSEEVLSPDEQDLAQAFADIVSVLVVHLGDVPPRQLEERLAEVLGGRVAIERAKGVLAEVHRDSMGAAYDRLVRDARESGQSLSGWAVQVVEDAQRRS